MSIFSLFGCFGEKYRVEYDSKGCYSNAKDFYRAGTKVKLYYEMIATDTDYSFSLDGEPLEFTYDAKKGFIIEFTMPEHNVKLECSAVNSMMYVPQDDETLIPETGPSET